MECSHLPITRDRTTYLYEVDTSYLSISCYLLGFYVARCWSFRPNRYAKLSGVWRESGDEVESLRVGHAYITYLTEPCGQSGKVGMGDQNPGR